MSRYLSRHLRASTDPRFEADWARQRRTAADILRRLHSQEGVILADQVGMGKTYVALAVAVSQILATPDLGQVVVFVPAAVADKWVREWSKFSKSLLEPGNGIRCVDRPIRSGEDLLKKLADGTHLLVVTHTALTSTLKDSFIQLALLHHATRYVRDGAELRRRIAKWSKGLSGLIRYAPFTQDRVSLLLDTPPSKWRSTWKRIAGEDLPDDPVPAALEVALRKLDLQDLRNALADLPINQTNNIEQRLNKPREALNKATQATWKAMLSSIELDLPLLIVDEAHRLKNPKTNISRLFGERADDSQDGAFNGMFRHMLFLTATPFELGHSELIEVLSRMGAVRAAESPPAAPLQARLETLEKALTMAQVCALSLDEAWGRLTPEEVPAFDGWGPTLPPPEGISASTREAWQHASRATDARRSMHNALSPWIIRHTRPRRRQELPGAAIAGAVEAGGLPIPASAALPFLLAARAQSVALDEKHARPLFAYGIVSSYEAFTRDESEQEGKDRDSDQPQNEEDGSEALASGENAGQGATAVSGKATDAVQWYRQEIQRALPSQGMRNSHPKVSATVEKAAQLWLADEKCLVFCWFIKTGATVERVLASRIEALVLQRAQEALGSDSAASTAAELDRISKRLFRRDSPSYERIRQGLVAEFDGAAPGQGDVVELVVDTVIRHLRRPESLVRYTELKADMTADDILAGVRGRNPGELIPIRRWRLFAKRLAEARSQIINSTPDNSTDSEFMRIREALLGARDEDDRSGGNGASLMPVRRAHGGTVRDVRERLITLFNTPFAPDLLVASSVMGEGIDLHQECRFVIHHDLDWNPSVLEQRTGRLDRIGAYAEREGKNIEVYEPYLAGTHDEKMFRVVKDRAQWFDIVMGRATPADEFKTDAEEARVPLHARIREALDMDLSSPE